mmetsp:Transcript_175156/g.556334  ORF Transcript_175156/g.556334 Transcript_175156/m.556334 type:complete len:80 (+) Transcript_175156:333-572(+)
MVRPDLVAGAMVQTLQAQMATNLRIRPALCSHAHGPSGRGERAFSHQAEGISGGKSDKVPPKHRLRTRGDLEEMQQGQP